MKPADNFDLRKFIAEGKLLKEDLQEDILDFWHTLLMDADQSDGEYEAEWDTEFFIEQFPEHEGKEQEINNISKKIITNLTEGKDEKVYSVTVSDGDYEQVIYIKGISDKEELKKTALSIAELSPKKTKISNLGSFSDLDEEEKDLFKGNVAVFEPESID